ncbi:MAG TPA: ABC transporter permease subunit [Terriglobales bacterium]
MHWLDGFVSMLRQFWPPVHDPKYLWALRTPVLETLEMAAGAMLFSASCGVLLALYIGARLPGWRLLYLALATVRAIPDLTMAILFVMVVGIGSPSGMLALSVFYTAAMGKVFADLFVSADPAPVEALHATGAGRTMVALYGLLPLRSKDLLTYGSYEFESKVRACVIVGAVGAGGLATEIIGTINQYSYQYTATVIIVLVLLVALIDRISWLVRRYPLVVIAFVPLGAISAWINWPQMLAFSHTVRTIRTMLPPHLEARDIHDIPRLLGETLWIAFGGTTMAALLGVVLGAAAARNLAPMFVYAPVRRLLELFRAIPDVVWGLLLVTTTVMGPWAGMLAIGLHSTGVFGKLYSESIENVQPEPVMALAAAGAPRLALAGFGLFPLAFPPIAIHTLFRFEWNMRAATIMGIIGAGGIGQALFNAQQLFFYNKVIAYVIIVWALVMLTDFANAQLRKRWKITAQEGA